MSHPNLVWGSPAGLHLRLSPAIVPRRGPASVLPPRYPRRRGLGLGQNWAAWTRPSSTSRTTQPRERPAGRQPPREGPLALAPEPDEELSHGGAVARRPPRPVLVLETKVSQTHRAPHRPGQPVAGPATEQAAGDQSPRLAEVDALQPAHAVVSDSESHPAPGDGPVRSSDAQRRRGSEAARLPRQAPRGLHAHRDSPAPAGPSPPPPSIGATKSAHRWRIPASNLPVLPVKTV